MGTEPVGYLQTTIASLKSSQLDFASLAFWKLLITGSYGAYSQQWLQLFKSMMALHLLVLSGSQAQGLRQFWELAVRLLPERVRSIALKILLSCNFILWLQAALWPAPLVRAFLLQMLGLHFPRMDALVRLLMAGLLHVSFFPEHLRSRSFYLSWLCYSGLLVAQKLSPRNSLLWAHFICWCLAWLLFRPQFLDLRQLYLLFVMNLILIVIFDLFLIPIVGWVLGLSFLAYIGLPSLWFFDAFLHLIIHGGTQVILVVVYIFRYILRI